MSSKAVRDLRKYNKTTEELERDMKALNVMLEFVFQIVFEILIRWNIIRHLFLVLSKSIYHSEF
jgi:hypothetical protein